MDFMMKSYVHIIILCSSLNFCNFKILVETYVCIDTHTEIYIAYTHGADVSLRRM